MKASATSIIVLAVAAQAAFGQPAGQAAIPPRFESVRQTKLTQLVCVWGTPRPLHQGTVTAVAISPNGKLGLSSGSFPSLALWDLANGQELSYFTGAQADELALGFTPDSATAISGARGLLRFWDLPSGTVRKTLPIANLHPACVALSSDGSLIFVGGRDGAAGLWDAKSLDPLWTGRISDAHTRNGQKVSVQQAVFTGSGDRLVAACITEVVVWDVVAREVVTTLAEEGDYSTFLAVSFDGTQAASLHRTSPTEPPQLRLWDIELGSVIRPLATHAHSRVSDARFTPDGKYLIAGHQSEISVWNVSTGEQEHYWLLPDKAGAPLSHLAISPTEHSVLIGSYQSGSSPLELQLIDWDTGKDRWTFSGHKGPVSALAEARDGQIVLTGGKDGSIRIWDRDGSIRSTIPQTETVGSIAIGPDSRQALVGATMDAVVYDLAGASRVRKFNVASAIVALTPDGRQGVLAPRDAGKSLRVVELATGVVKELSDTDPAGRFVAISDDARLAASSSFDRAANRLGVRIWDVAEARMLGTLDIEKSDFVELVFSPDGSSLICGMSKGRIDVWDVRSASLQTTLQAGGESIIALAIHPDNDVLMALSGASIHLMSLKRGVELDQLTFPFGVESPYRGLFSRDGTSFFVGTRSGLILRFSLKQP